MPVFHELQNMTPVILENPGAHIHYVTLTRYDEMKWPNMYFRHKKDQIFANKNNNTNYDNKKLFEFVQHGSETHDGIL